MRQHRSQTQLTLALAMLAASSYPLRAGIPVDVNAAFFAQIADGGGWKSKIILRSTASQSTRVRVEFRDGFGAQLPLRLVDGRSGWFIEDTVYSLGSLFLETDGSGNLKQGFVRVSTPECATYDTGSFCGGSVSGISGQIFFQERIPGKPLYEAALTLDSVSTSVILPFDNTSNYLTALAVLNPYANAGQRVRLTFRDTTGGVITENFVSLGPRQRSAFATTDYSEVANHRGSVTVLSDSGSSIVAFGLLFNPDGPFSTLIPIIDRY